MREWIAKLWRAQPSFRRKNVPLPEFTGRRSVISKATTGRSLCEWGSTANMASSRAMAPSRFCSPSSSESDRSGELLSFQPDYCSAPGTFYEASVGELGGVGALHWHAKSLQEGPRSFGECGSGIHQHFHWFRTVARLGQLCPPLCGKFPFLSLFLPSPLSAPYSSGFRSGCIA